MLTITNSQRSRQTDSDKATAEQQRLDAGQAEGQTKEGNKLAAEQTAEQEEQQCLTEGQRQDISRTDSGTAE